MTLFLDKYRVETVRNPGRDYRLPGKYFVTICTKNLVPWFGEIRNGIIGLSNIGCIIADEIQRTPFVRSYISIDRWVVMPNHVHLIIAINSIETNIVETSRRDVSTHVKILIPLFRTQSHSLGSIVQQIKCCCTKHIRSMGYHDFAWQTRFHDRIIRNEKMLYNIRSYIMNNPLKWKSDHNYIL